MGSININTAPKMVLRSLAEEISPELADKMDEYRTKEGNDLSSTSGINRYGGGERSIAGIADYGKKQLF
jgi:DNA uptake protein ComE-like DNA-binding protein